MKSACVRIGFGKPDLIASSAAHSPSLALLAPSPSLYCCEEVGSGCELAWCRIHKKRDIIQVLWLSWPYWECGFFLQKVYG